jgi:hypothetical protein
MNAAGFAVAVPTGAASPASLLRSDFCKGDTLQYMLCNAILMMTQLQNHLTGLGSFLAGDQELL